MGIGSRYPHVVRLLKKYARPNDRVLELGCGGAVYKDFFIDRYIGIDLPASPYAQQGDISVYCSAEALPFKSRIFDLLFIVAALYQIPEESAVLSEALRVLCMGGYLLIFDYTWRTTWRLEKSEGSKCHHWTQWQLARIVRNHGFKTYVSSEWLPEPKARWKRMLTRTRLGKFLRLVLNEIRGGWNVVVAVKKS